jgi:DNA polymerase-1
MDYAKGDGLTTLLLREAQYALITERDEVDSSQEFIHKVESRLIWTLFRMERRGWKVDEQYLPELISAIEKELVVAKSALPKDFNERSPKQTKEYMELHGITNWPTTDAGNPSFTEKFLRQSEPGQNIMSLRQNANLLSKFAYPLRDSHVFKGRVHAQLNQLKSDEGGTISGRLSCSEPNMQAITKRNKKLGPRFRRCFIPDEGFQLYENDYSQCEPRLFAHYSREPRLLDGYNNDPPLDMHHVVAEGMNVERDPTAKRMNMGILTGMQKKTFAEHMEWPLEKASQYHDWWFDLFPGIRQFQITAKNNLLQRGYVRTVCGRRCRLDNPRFAYKAVSKIIQGGNADVIKVKLLAIDEWLEQEENDAAHLIMTIHDSIIFQAPLGDAGTKLAKRMKEMAVDVKGPPFNLRVPFVMDSGFGPNWAVATYGESMVNEVVYGIKGA